MDLLELTPGLRSFGKFLVKTYRLAFPSFWNFLNSSAHDFVLPTSHTLCFIPLSSDSPEANLD